jgi:hypothetical protein
MIGNKWGEFAKWGQLMTWYDCSYTIGPGGTPIRIEIYVNSEGLLPTSQSIRFRASTSSIEQ